jgi:hypothetical protein
MVAALHSDLAQISALCADSGRKRKLPKAAGSGSQLSVVAGAATAENSLYHRCRFDVSLSPVSS